MKSMMKSTGHLWRRVILGLALATVACARPPNVVFILADDLGWTDLASFGSELYHTPNIDRLAKEGMRFDRSYAACTVCSPTRAAVLTGRYPAALHLTDWIAGHKRPFAKLKVPDWTMELDLKEPNLARTFHDAGYVTAHMGKWHLGEEPFWPEHQGFDVNVGGWSIGSPNHAKGANGYFSPWGNPRLPDGPVGEFLDDRLASEACTFIEKNRGRPFFLNFWPYLVHAALQSEPDRVAQYATAAAQGQHQRNPTYAAMVQRLDEEVGKILATLDQLGLRENTIVVFTSDNGGLIGNNGRNDLPPKVTSNYPLRTGKGDVYEGGIRVPLVVRYPGVVAAGTVSSTPVISIDFFPTLLELAGCPTTEAVRRSRDGLSFASILRGAGKGLARDALYWHYPHYHTEGAAPYGAVLKGPWKLIEFYEDNHTELYNIDRDIGEQHDLSAQESGKRNELLADLRAWRAKVGAQMPVPNPNYDPAKDRWPPPGAPKANAKKKP
jgi:arylsulfatase A-like enzyme